EIDPGEEVERRFGKMNMRGLARSRSRFVVDWAVECDEHDKNRIAPLVLLHLARDFLSHHFDAEQVEHEVTRVYVRDHQLTHRNFLAVCQAYGSGAFGVAQNFCYAGARPDFAAMRLQIFSESDGHAVHPAFDKIVAHILQDRSKKPTELGATGVVGRCARKVANEPNRILIASASRVWFAHDRTLCMLNR